LAEVWDAVSPFIWREVGGRREIRNCLDRDLIAIDSFGGEGYQKVGKRGN